MFPEYCDLITTLKSQDHHFSHLFEKHSQLDQRIRNLEAHIAPDIQGQIETLKKEKLLLKDQIYLMLRKAQDYSVRT